MLLIFSSELVSKPLLCHPRSNPGMGVLTNIQDITPTTCVQMQRGIACRAILRFELSNKLVETGLVGYVGTRELQYPLAAEGVFERLLANGTLAPNKRALSARPTPVRIHRGVYRRCGSRVALA